MNFDFAKLLKSFANGDHLNSPEGMIDEALKRTPAAAPQIHLMPSQEAATELVSGLQGGGIAPGTTQISNQVVQSPGVLPGMELPSQADVVQQPYDERVLPVSPTNSALMEPNTGVAIPAPTNVMDQQVTPSANQLINLPAENNPVTAAQAAAQAARDQPIKPQSFWKDFGAKLIQGADAFFNGNKAPIVGWGRLKHDEAVKVADENVGRLQKEQDYNNDQARSQAQTEELRGRPQARLDLEKQKAKNASERIKLHADIRSGEARPYVDDEGKIWRQYLKADSSGKVRANEPQIGADGLQDTVPGEQGIEWLNPRTNKIEIIKARQGASADAAIAAGDAIRTQGAAEANARRLADWQEEKASNETKRQALKSKADGLRATMAQLTASNDVLRSQLAKAPTTKEEADAQAKVQAQIAAQDRDLQQKEGESVAAEKEAAGIVDRPEPKEVEASTIGSKVKVSVSEDEFKAKLKAGGIPESEWAWRVSQARTDKVIK